MEEIESLRKIADEAKNVWDKGWLSLEAIHLKNLLTDRIDFNDRHNKALKTDAESRCHHAFCRYTGRRIPCSEDCHFRTA